MNGHNGLSVEVSLGLAEQSGRYLIMVTYIEPQTEILKHDTFTNDFPYVDMERSVLEHSKHLADLKRKAGPPKKRIANEPQRSQENPQNPAA